MHSHDIAPTEEAVLSVLAGTPVDEAARQAGTSPVLLALAVERYRAAGRAALDQQPGTWYQVNIEFTDYTTAATAFGDCLLPVLSEKTIGLWWFIRKHPHWRLRIKPAPGTPTGEIATSIAQALDTAVSHGTVRRWRPTLYEPETIAFGGPDGMTTAHHLFHTDSRGVLTYHRAADAGTDGLPDAKTTSLLVLTLLLRAAGLEWGEQGDVWGQVEALRPLPPAVPPERVTAMVLPMRTLLTRDAGPALTNGPLTPLRRWIIGMEHSGQELKDAAHDGRLTLGLRAVLARHVLFHWNRMGFNTRQQAIWARAAREALLGQ
ncbi:thiopeptide-type bacteriocin biosynthesis protein [Streptomyces thermoalcalitolerans]|uniref:Thiopeptide-type bacteriocin biosynthesis domain-containing protein n=1 Tax=Streptomyces thermoalcalitolerans TaxID=65605 RepID=A0ABN1NGM2_9ACTN